MSNLNKQNPKLRRSFYQREPVTLAKALLGQRLVHIDKDGQRCSGIIVEVESYLGVKDKAAHVYGGHRSGRNESMWGPAGHSYVYFTYGMHYCMNVVAQKEGVPEAVLIRALQPEQNLDLMHKRRKKAKKDTDLCSGPAKLCQALAIDKTQDGIDLVNSTELFIEQLRKRAPANKNIVTAPRVGINSSQEWAAKPLRFYLKGNPNVSVK